MSDLSTSTRRRGRSKHGTQSASLQKSTRQLNNNADQVAHQLLLNDKGNRDSIPQRENKQVATEYMLTSPFRMEDLLRGIMKTLKNNKVAGLDDVNKQFELLEFVFDSVYVNLQYDEISLTFTAGPVCLCGVCSPVVVLGL